jgi:outer membrane protein assembly factor BamE
MSTPSKIVSISLAIVSFACSTPQFPSVHKVSIQQGNIVTQDMVNQLVPGMTKEQVKFILGTPLIKDSFNQNHWIYLNNVTNARSQKKEKRLEVFFSEQNKLSLLRGDYRPSDAKLGNSLSETEGH